MSIGLDDADMEFEGLDGSESEDLWNDSEDYDVDDDDGGESRPLSPREREERRRRIVRARRLRSRTRSRTPVQRSAARPVVPVRPTPQQAVAAIKNLDLDNKVQEDAFRRAISTQSKRMNRSDLTTVASTAVNQALATFDKPENVYFKAALRFAPLMMLSPQRQGSGVRSFLLDPRVLGFTALAGITVLGERQKRGTLASKIHVDVPASLKAGQSETFVARALDKNDQNLNLPVVWKPLKAKGVKITSDGEVTVDTTATKGSALFTVETGGLDTIVRVSIEP